MADSVQQPTAERSLASRLLPGRDRLARLVVVGSFLTIFLLVGILLVLAQQAARQETTTAATNAFNAILPVLAGWVGTVLAFYFSAVSQERTNDTLDKALGQSPTGTGSALVTAKMIPLVSVRKHQVLDKETRPETIHLTKLRTAFSDTSEGPVTRLLFTENGVFRYIVHIGTFEGFLQKQAPQAPAEKDPPATPGDGDIPPPAPSDDGNSGLPGGEGAPQKESGPNTQGSSDTKPPQPRTIEQLTLRDMLEDPDTLHSISKLVVFVSAAATVAEAQTALATVKGAQDIIVTATGNASLPVLGWLSNVDLPSALAEK